MRIAEGNNKQMQIKKKELTKARKRISTPTKPYIDISEHTLTACVEPRH